MKDEKRGRELEKSKEYKEVLIEKVDFNWIVIAAIFPPSPAVCILG